MNGVDEDEVNDVDDDEVDDICKLSRWPDCAPFRNRAHLDNLNSSIDEFVCTVMAPKASRDKMYNLRHTFRVHDNMDDMNSSSDYDSKKMSVPTNVPWSTNKHYAKDFSRD